MLVFTQFREVTGRSRTFLGAIFGRPGLVLHGDAGARSGAQLVEALPGGRARCRSSCCRSRRAGTGPEPDGGVARDPLRPLVESGGREPGHRPRLPHRPARNVLVHKFVCRGTVEEKIDALIESKRQLSKDLLDGGA
jgi:hypothetical protein